MIYVVPELSRVTVPAGGAVDPGEIADIEFVWSRAEHCKGLIVIPRDGTPETLAKLAIGIVDQQHEQIVTDRRGRVLGQVQPNVAPCLALMGRGFYPFDLQRDVLRNDVWTITLKNYSLATVDIAAVGLFVRDEWEQQ